LVGIRDHVLSGCGRIAPTPFRALSRQSCAVGLQGTVTDDME
jgi:hypothetical protein